MPDPTLLGDVIQPAWNSLSAEQRTAWHFWAAQHPQFTEGGYLFTMFGQQAHYSRNADLAVAETPTLLDDPPPNTTPPPTPRIDSYAWPLQAQLADTSEVRQGLAFLDFPEGIPADTVVTVRQGYDRKKKGKPRPPRIRHVTVADDSHSGVLSLTVAEGYFASTAGNTKYARIKGVTARRRPELPLGTARVTNTTNGESIRLTISNPYGGARTQSARAPATQFSDSTRNHFP